jgi:diamine N-acetyltransferase
MSSSPGSPSETRPREAAGPRLLVGESVYLRRMEPGDLEHVLRWLSDAELCGLIGHPGVQSLQEVEAWYERASAEPTRRWYVILTSEDDRVIGEAGLLRMDERWRTTDMSIVIGERDAWRRGYGREVGRILLNFAFDYCGMHRVAVGVVGFHEGALRFWESLGFRREGLQRDGYLHEGRFHDFVMMSMLENEWLALRGSAASRD